MSSADEQAREIARAREESQWAWQHTLYHTEERAREEKAIEMAKEMLADEMSLEVISKYTKLPTESIKALASSIQDV